MRSGGLQLENVNVIILREDVHDTGKTSTAKVRRRGKWRYFSALWFSTKFITFHLTFYLCYLFLSFRTFSKLLHISYIGILCVE